MTRRSILADSEGAICISDATESSVWDLETRRPVYLPLMKHLFFLLSFPFFSLVYFASSLGRTEGKEEEKERNGNKKIGANNRGRRNL